MRRELRLQKRIVKLIKDAGGEARIVAQSAWTTVGDGDVIGCLRGQFIYLEVKDGDDYKPTKIQLHRLRKWEKAGAWAYVVTSYDEAVRIVGIVRVVADNSDNRDSADG